VRKRRGNSLGTRCSLFLQDRLIGVLDLESAVPHAFTAEHERMLVTLGSYIAVALENARLYEDSRESERRLRHEMDSAREIQRQLLPTGAREVPGLDLAAAYVPARDLAEIFMISFPTEKAGWASRSAMFPAKALPQPSTAPWRSHGAGTCRRARRRTG